ncbi:MAG: phytanoyl-CoA dioxygenase family protein [Planctomycetaceae bacterium]|nr:phytanoyl-CoA dioxygenase family protein [Planctomycetaceae bacterium]
MPAQDYGLKHGLVSDLFTWPRSPKEWEQYLLTKEQLEQFRDKGFVSGITLLNKEQVEQLRDELEEVAQQDHPGREFFYEYHSNESDDRNTTLFHALGAWRVRPGLHDVLWNPAFLMPAYQLLGSGFRMFHDQLFSKPAQHGGVVAWHQDFAYWTWTRPLQHLTCWIGLDDVDTENGCLYYIPGSHRWGLVEKTSLAGDMYAVREALTPEQQLEFDQKIPIEMKRGQASFHHPVLMHGSYENRSSRSRRATVINVFADGTLSNINEQNRPGSGSYPEFPPGEKMGDPYYPLLLDPQREFGDFLSSIPTLKSVGGSCS